MEFKELESERLLLVESDKKYATDFLRFMDEETTRYMTNERFKNLQEAEDFLEICEDMKQRKVTYGYGKEAVECLCAYAQEHKEYEGFLYPVDKENRKSIRLVKELGGVPLDEVEDFKKEDGRILHLVTYVLSK